MVTYVENKGVPVMCCGKKMEELQPGTVEAHYIPFIWVETTKGNQMKSLKPEEKPEATFVLTDKEEVVGVYAYCNLHGLWKAE